MNHSALCCSIRSCTLLLLWCMIPVVQASDNPAATLGFTGLKAGGINVREATAYSEQLRREINAAGIYSALEFTDITNRLAEQGLPDTCFSMQCAVVAGQILGTSYFGYGSIGSVGKKSFQISMQIVEVRTGRIVGDVSKFYKGKLKDFVGIIIPQFARAISGIAVEDPSSKKK